MPWEIPRSIKATPDGRPIEIVTKGGTLKGYFSVIALIPEFVLGVSILFAGEEKVMLKVRENIIGALVREADRIARERLKHEFAGVFGTLCMEVGTRDPSLKLRPKNQRMDLRFGKPNSSLHMSYTQKQKTLQLKYGA